MRFVPIDKVQPGMVLAMDVNGLDGRTLIGSSMTLNEKFIERLKGLGFTGVYVADELSKDIDIEMPISPVLRANGLECIKKGNIDGCIEVAKQIVGEILNRGHVSLDMLDLRSYDDYTYAHSVNVAILSSAIGLGMKMSETDMAMLVTAALLHDLGKLSIPSEILNKKDRLTAKEFEIMKTHSTLSYEFIKERWDISSHVKGAVLFHHENMDGSGYPAGLPGEEQSLFTRILHVADVYDALTSKRPYKEPYSPYESMEYLMGGCGILFDRDVVEVMKKCVPLFPKGTEIELSDGRRGIIKENHGVYNLRPIVRLMNGAILDLSKPENLNISIIPPGEFHAHVTDSEDSRKKMISAKVKKILIVDDMATNLEILNEMLKDSYSVVLAKSGFQAVGYIKKNQDIDLILMDVDMPDMDGIETTKRIQEITNGTIPVLFVSALHDKKTVLACRDLGGAGYVVRPYNEVYLISQIRKILIGWGECET